MSQRALKVLCLTTVFPNPTEAGLGLFVRSRLQQVAEEAEVKVIAPVPLIDYTRSGRRWIGSRSIPLRWTDGLLDVYHPRWLYPPLGSPINVPLLAARLLPVVWKLRQSYNFDLIDAHFAYPDGVAAFMVAAAFRAPLLVTIRGNETMHAQRLLRRRLITGTLQKADRVIAVSESLRKFAVGLGVPSDRTVTIPNGIDTSRFHPRDRKECRRKFGIGDEEKIVFSAGALTEGKGHHRVIEALHALRADGLDATLLIAGGGQARSGDYEKEIRGVAASLEMESRVRLLGQVTPDAMAELMCAADVFCLASAREGWPNVLHEALGSGTPVVATDVGAVSDMIPSGDFGLIVPVGDQTALAASLREALGRDWDREAIARWAGARTWRQVGAEVLEEMRKVVEESREKRKRSR